MSQFSKNTDPVLSKLIDPVRGYCFTCLRCQKHIKEDAVSTHLCEGERITLSGVEFVRDQSMRYKCGVCQVTVPIVLVRAHVARHPGRGGLEEEEWRNCTVPVQSEAGETPPTESNTPAKLSPDTSKKPCFTEKEAYLKSAPESKKPCFAEKEAFRKPAPESKKQPAEVSLTRPSEFLSAPTSHSLLDSELQSTTKSSLTPLTSTGGRKKLKRPAQGAVMDCIRKVRKVQLALERVGMAGRRILYLALAIEQ